jgi:hypothetical protein
MQIKTLARRYMALHRVGTGFLQWLPDMHPINIIGFKPFCGGLNRDYYGGK